jgi:hypothetical protein
MRFVSSGFCHEMENRGWSVIYLNERSEFKELLFLVVVQLVGKLAKRAIIASKGTRRFARLAQILHCAKNACSRMTIKLHHCPIVQLEMP